MISCGNCCSYLQESCKLWLSDKLEGCFQSYFHLRQLAAWGADMRDPTVQAFERSPANLVRMDNNNFVLTVPASQSGSEAVSEEQLVELEKDPHAGHQVISLSAGTPLHRSSPELLEGDSKQNALSSWPFTKRQCHSLLQGPPSIHDELVPVVLRCSRGQQLYNKACDYDKNVSGPAHLEG